MLEKGKIRCEEARVKGCLHSDFCFEAVLYGSKLTACVWGFPSGLFGVLNLNQRR